MAPLGSILTGLFAHRIDGTEPHIVDLEAPIPIAGLSVATDSRRIYQDAAPFRLPGARLAN